MPVNHPEPVLTGEVERFTVSAVVPERTRAAATRSLRWHEVLEAIA